MATIKSEMPPLHAAEALAGTAGVAGGGGGGAGGASGNTNSTSNTAASSAPSAANNTISAAADSSDNQPSTPQPQITANEQQSAASATAISHHPYATHHMYAAAGGGPITTTATTLPHMYATGIYGGAGQDMQQQQQHHSGYPSYLNSYEQFYQQQSQQNMYDGMYGGNAADYKSSAGVRYHPYLQAPTSGGSAANADNLSGDTQEGSNPGANAASAPLSSLSNSSAAVSTTTAMSPRVVSSTSPTSTSSNLQLSGNPTSPGCKLQCKKCGIMCTNEADLQEHITNVHGASPYGSSGYSSSPYIKEEVGTQQPPPQQQQQSGGNPGNLLDLDSQKMVYPPAPGGIQPLLHHPHQQQLHDAMAPSDPLHSMHSMQQRALPGWDQPAPIGLQEGLPPYMQHQQQDVKTLSNQSPYYSPKQSPYHVPAGVTIKQEYPVIKSEYADSQNYVDKSFDPTGAGEMCQTGQTQQPQPPPMMPVSSSPAEFPSTTTGPQDQAQQFRSFEPPTSSSVLPASNITAKAATWKSNEARRPKTYNCTACNKWFTSSGHLKRHYNTTLHKNAVKSSGQPDPATLPISVHHHPARDPTTKHSRRNNSAAAAAAQQQQQPPAPVQPPEPPRSPPDYNAQAAGLGQMSHYSTSPSPTQQANGLNYGQAAQQNGYPQQQYMQQVQSTTNASPQHASNLNAGASPTQTVLNGHPNGLAGPSAPTTTTPMPSSHTRGLLNTTTIPPTITKIEPMEDNSPMDMEMEMLQQQHQQQLEEEADAEQQRQRHQRHMEEAAILEAHPMALRHPAHYLSLDQQQQRQFHNSTPSSTHSMRVQSPLTISHQHYQQQLQQQQMVDTIFSHTPPLQPQAVHMPRHNIMDQQYSIIPLGTNMPQHSNSTPLLQQPPHITTNTATTSMDSIHTMLHSHHQQQQLEQPGPVPLPHMHSTLLSNTSIPSPLDTTSTTTTHTPPPHITTTTQQQLQLPRLQQPPHITNTIPSFQQLQQASGLAPLEHTMTYHTIIGSNAGLGGGNCTSELLQLTAIDSYGNFQGQPQMITTSDGQLLQFIPTAQMMGQPLFTMPTRASVAETYAPLSPYSAQRSPQEADLPPAQSMAHGSMQTQESQTLNVLPSTPYSPTISSSEDYVIAHKVYSSAAFNDYTTSSTAADSSPAAKKRKRTYPASGVAPKRKRAPPVGSTSPSTTTLPTGRIKCLECDKEFTKICYLTQHNKSFHSGEYPYRCQKCGKRFQSEDIYDAHLGRHKALDKPHKCELCPKQFHHKTDLRRHIEAIHTGLKQHMCDVCKKTFCRKDHLRKHLETHNRPRVVSKRALRAMGAKKTVGTEGGALKSPTPQKPQFLTNRSSLSHEDGPDDECLLESDDDERHDDAELLLSHSEIKTEFLMADQQIALY